LAHRFKYRDWPEARIAVFANDLLGSLLRLEAALKKWFRWGCHLLAGAEDLWGFKEAR